MANTLNLGNGNWGVKKDSLLGYNSENGNFKPLPFDFTRDTLATRVNKDGLIETVGSGEPRIDYKDDSKGALLLEPSRSNLILNSQKISLSPIKNGTFTDDFAISPDGTQNATKFTAPSIDPYFYQSVSFSAGSYTASIYVKGIGNSIGKDFRIVLGSNSSNPKLKIPSEWTRFEYTATMTSGSATAGLEIPDPAVVGDDVLVWGFQVEQGSYATSYIPTQGGAVTRVEEDIALTLPNNASFDSSVGFTLCGEFLTNGGSGSSSMALQVNGNLGYFGFGSNGSTWRARINNGTVNSAHISNIPILSTVKLALSFNSSGFSMYANGTSFASGNTNIGAITSADSILYRDTDEFGSFRIKDLKLYNTRLSNSELIALTS